MNLMLAIITLFFLESSCGKNLHGEDPGCKGPLQIKQCVLTDLEQRYGVLYTSQDCMDKTKSFAIAVRYINLYCKKPTIRQVLLLWRCGPEGRHHPNAKQRAYVTHGQDVYKQLCRGVPMEELK